MSVLSLDRHNPQPLYLQLAEAITADIRDHQRPPGFQLATEEHLMAAYGVSRVTIRQAMKVLERRGLVVRRRGKGTFVAAARVVQDHSVLPVLYDTLVGHGIEPEMRLLDYRPVTPPPAVRRLLGHDTAVLLMRLYSINSSPLALTRGYLHPAALGISRALAEVFPSYHILQSLLKMRIDHANLSVRALAAPPTIARHLAIPPRSPILAVNRATYGAGDECLEYDTWHLRAEVYELALRVDGPAPMTRTLRPARTGARSRGTN